MSERVCSQCRMAVRSNTSMARHKQSNRCRKRAGLPLLARPSPSPAGRAAPVADDGQNDGADDSVDEVEASIPLLEFSGSSAQASLFSCTPLAARELIQAAHTPNAELVRLKALSRPHFSESTRGLGNWLQSCHISAAKQDELLALLNRPGFDLGGLPRTSYEMQCVLDAITPRGNVYRRLFPGGYVHYVDMIEELRHILDPTALLLLVQNFVANGVYKFPWNGTLWRSLQNHPAFARLKLQGAVFLPVNVYIDGLQHFQQQGSIYVVLFSLPGQKDGRIHFLAAAPHEVNVREILMEVLVRPLQLLEAGVDIHGTQACGSILTAVADSPASCDMFGTMHSAGQFCSRFTLVEKEAISTSTGRPRDSAACYAALRVVAGEPATSTLVADALRSHGLSNLSPLWDLPVFRTDFFDHMGNCGLHLFLLGVGKRTLSDVLAGLSGAARQELNALVRALTSSPLALPWMRQLPDLLVIKDKSKPMTRSLSVSDASLPAKARSRRIVEKQASLVTMNGAEWRTFYAVSAVALAPFLPPARYAVWQAYMRMFLLAASRKHTEQTLAEFDVARREWERLVLALGVRDWNIPNLDAVRYVPEVIRRHGHLRWTSSGPYEAQNKVVKKAAAAGNRQAPPRDVALEFDRLKNIDRQVSFDAPAPASSSVPPAPTVRLPTLPALAGPGDAGYRLPANILYTQMGLSFRAADVALPTPYSLQKFNSLRHNGHFLNPTDTVELLYGNVTSYVVVEAFFALASSPTTSYAFAVGRRLELATLQRPAVPSCALDLHQDGFEPVCVPPTNSLQICPISFGYQWIRKVQVIKLRGNLYLNTLARLVELAEDFSVSAYSPPN